MRRQLVLMISFAALAGEAAACDLDPRSRPSGVAAYVETALPCLQNPEASVSFDAALEARFLALINDERRLAGLAPVQLRTELMGAARFHSLDMAVNGFFGHQGLDGRSPQDRIAALDRTALAVFNAENVATVSRVGGRISSEFASRRLHRNLMDSPGHRANILHPKATHAAIGVARRPDGVWLTQLFMGLAGTLEQEAPLRIASPRGLRAPAGLEGWRFVRYEIVSPGGEPWPASLRPGPGIDARLAAYATQPGDGPRSFYWVRFQGPAVTVAP